MYEQQINSKISAIFFLSDRNDLTNSRRTLQCWNRKVIINLFFFRFILFVHRSGTFCAIHILYHFMKQHFVSNYSTPPINVVNTILQLRKQRPGMVQTKVRSSHLAYLFIIRNNSYLCTKLFTNNIKK